MVSSGLRIGTPALATRGFGDEEFSEVADIIATALKADFDEETRSVLAKRVTALADRFPLYPNLTGTSGVA
jgi:glycine hydroxymethyltransferase